MQGRLRHLTRRDILDLKIWLETHIPPNKYDDAVRQPLDSGGSILQKIEKKLLEKSGLLNCIYESSFMTNHQR